MDQFYSSTSLNVVNISIKDVGQETVFSICYREIWISKQLEGLFFFERNGHIFYESKIYLA